MPPFSPVKLTIPSQSIQIKDMRIYVPCLKLGLDIYFPKGFQKINQIELGEEFAYISVSYIEKPQYEPTCLIGVDRNTTHHQFLDHKIVIANKYKPCIYGTFFFIFSS